ncbi:MAG: nucleotidyltransferase family protein [Methyloligellaceae bacterium]
MTAVTRAMVLAAGLGERMRPLTETLPKPLIPLAGKPLIDHVLDGLAAAGVTRAVVNLHYLADRLESHLQARKRPEIIFSDEREAILDTGGGVARALPLIGGEPFFIHNSDSVWIDGVGSQLARMAAVWDPARMDALLLMAPTQSAIGYDGPGDFTMDEQGLLARRGEGEIAPFAFAGASIAGRALFQDAPSGAFSLNRQWDRALEAGRLYGLRLDGTWMHVGTPAALDAAERLMRGSGG